MNKSTLSRYFPMGIDFEKELRWIYGSFAFSVFYSLSFFWNYFNHYDLLFRKDPMGIKHLIDGAVMPDFYTIALDNMLIFVIAAAAWLILAVYHYFYHYQGSKSIYLMKRLPDRFELWRRCLAVPVISSLMLLLAASVLLMLYLLFYMVKTPSSCLTPNQFSKLISAIFGGVL